MSDWITGLLLLTGALFCLLAALGVLRLPDMLTRMNAATKSGTLGVGMLMMAVAVHFETAAVTTRALLVVVFLFLTGPVAAHLIARAAYRSGTALWSGTSFDELRDARQRALSDSPRSDPPPPRPDPPSEDGTSPGSRR